MLTNLYSQSVGCHSTSRAGWPGFALDSPWRRPLVGGYYGDAEQDVKLSMPKNGPLPSKLSGFAWPSRVDGLSQQAEGRSWLSVYRAGMVWLCLLEGSGV